MKKLRIFDFDDTLALTDSAVKVVRNGKTVMHLSSHEFKFYRLRSGEEFDLSGFEKVLNPKVIKPTMMVLRKVLGKPSPAIILTGRGAAEPVSEWLNSIGVRPNGIVALGRQVSNAAQLAQAKAKWIADAIESEGWTFIEVFEDSKDNISAIKGLQKKFPDVKFVVRYVGHYAEKMKVHMESRRSTFRFDAWKLFEGITDVRI